MIKDDELFWDELVVESAKAVDEAEEKVIQAAMNYCKNLEMKKIKKLAWDHPLRNLWEKCFEVHCRENALDLVLRDREKNDRSVVDTWNTNKKYVARHLS